MPKPTQVPCRACGAVFAPSRKDAVYCSARCRAAYFQKRTRRTHIKDGDTLVLNGKTFWVYSSPK